jgi:AbrB family looped-hinge helix DNA binding protein
MQIIYNCQIMLVLAIMSVVSIDKFGRVLIPKKVREQLALQAGGALELSVEAGKLILSPEQNTVMRLVQGVPVFNVDGDEALAWLRSERDKGLSETP